MPRRFFASTLFAGWSALVLAATLPGLLQKAKEEFRFEKYGESLRTLDELDVESSKPGLENDRTALEPILAFYRGANLAALGRRDEAKTQFASFLRLQPDSSLDPSIYPRKVMAAFEEARKEAEAGTSSRSSIGEAYSHFTPTALSPSGASGDEWVEGPVRFLLTPAEKEDFTHRRDPVSRSKFVEEFWRSRDPNPQTPENELRQELEKRAAFADSRFSRGETRGSTTDRGMVFILLGPPTYVGQQPIISGRDVVAVNPASDRGVTGSKYSGKPGSRLVTKLGEPRSSRELWHYRREALPAEVPYQQLDVEFLTKEGFGEDVLQLDAPVLDTLERAKARLRREP